MSVKDILTQIGEMIQSTFPIMKSLKNTPNVIFIIVLSTLFIWWIWKMMHYDKEAEQTGSMR